MTLAGRAPARYLAEGERVVLATHRHPTVLLPPLLTALAVVAGASFLGTLVSPGEGGDPVDLALGLVAMFFTARLLWRIVQWGAERIVLTDQRMVEISGVFTRRVASMPLERMTDMTYRRTLLGRVLGYGEFLVETAGQVQALTRIDHLPRPDEFYRTVTSLMRNETPPPARLFDSEVFKRADDQDTGPLPRIVL